MSLHDRAAFEAFISKLKSVEIVHQWGDASVGKVGGKIFAILSGWNDDGVPQVVFKCSDMSFEMLPELDGVAKAKYLARAKWVQVQRTSALSDDDIAAYIVEAHRLISAKLTKKLQAELGLNQD